MANPRPRRSRGIAAGLVLLLAASSFGCYGSFRATRAVHKFNGSITGSRVIHSLLAWLMLVFLPVYGIAVLIDFVVINLIEFWSGGTVIVGMREEQPDGTTIVLEPGDDGSTLLLQVLRGEEVLEERLFARLDDGRTEVRDGGGLVVGMVSPDGQGGFLLANHMDGSEHALRAADIAELRRALATK